jgi:hypothetical protein
VVRATCGMQPDEKAGRPGPDRGRRRTVLVPAQRTGSGKGKMAPGGNKTFEARCEAREPGYALVALSGLSVFIAQRIRSDNREQMWDSVVIRCAEEPDGTLAVRVFISNPDWKELLQIACIRSRPGDAESLTPLGCNLDHIAESQT